MLTARVIRNVQIDGEKGCKEVKTASAVIIITL
jgi:hypothetical protein